MIDVFSLKTDVRLNRFDTCIMYKERLIDVCLYRFDRCIQYKDRYHNQKNPESYVHRRYLFTM